MWWTAQKYNYYPPCALALLPLKIPRDSISLLLTGQLNMGSAGQLTWRPNFRWCQKVLPLPCSFFLLQQWQNKSLVPPLYCPKPAPCVQRYQWPAHMHSLAFHLGAASRVYQALFMGMSAQKQSQCLGQNNTGFCPYTPGWHLLESCKSDPVLDAAEIFLSPLLASHAPGISLQLPVETFCILPYTGKQSKHSSRVTKGIIKKEDKKGFTIPCTVLPCCCSVMPSHFQPPAAIFPLCVYSPVRHIKLNDYFF